MLELIKMDEENLRLVLNGFCEYYNMADGCSWTELKAWKYIDQRVTIKDSFSFILKEDGIAKGFELGHFHTYDDGITFDIDEIVIFREYQDKGLGGFFIDELCKMAKENGAFLVQLESVNDYRHLKFYKSHGLMACNNLIAMSKLL